jgi:MFS-type transporter involved in bile tolerance (Atg22 family)
VIHPRLAGIGLLVAIGCACWLLVFNLPLLMFSHLGFCESAAELSKADPDCPEPLWYWTGILSVPVMLVVSGIRKGYKILKERN